MLSWRLTERAIHIGRWFVDNKPLTGIGHSCLLLLLLWRDSRLIVLLLNELTLEVDLLLEVLLLVDGLRLLNGLALDIGLLEGGGLWLGDLEGFEFLLGCSKIRQKIAILKATLFLPKNKQTLLFEETTC
jgi:hypothetical protein